MAFMGHSRCVQECIILSTSKAVYGFVKVYAIYSFFQEFTGSTRLAWRFMGSYKGSYNSSNIGYKYSYPTNNHTNYP